LSFHSRHSDRKLLRPQKAATLVKLLNVDDETYRDLKFSVRDSILRISSKRGDSLNAVFCPPEKQPEKDNFQFRVDKNNLPAHNTDFFINNVENRQELNEKDSLKGQIKHPQIPYINLFVSTPNNKHRPVMLQPMRDSGCAKSVIRKDVFETVPFHNFLFCVILLKILLILQKQNFQGLKKIQNLASANIDAKTNIFVNILLRFSLN